MQQKFDILDSSGKKLNDNEIIKKPSKQVFDGFYEYTNALRDNYDEEMEYQLTQNEGKWIIEFDNQSDALDTAWIKALDLLKNGALYSIKVAGYNKDYNNQSIFIYTKNAEDKNDVLLILELLLHHKLHENCKSISYKSNKDTFEMKDVRKYEEEKNDFINNPDSLDTLKIKKDRIHDEKATIAFDNLINHIEKIKDTENEQATKTLKLMHNALSPWEENRKQAQRELRDLGNTLMGHPRRGLQALGVLLVIFGAAMIVTGVLLTVGTFGLATPGGIGLAIGGGLVAAAGIGLFAHNPRKQFSEDVTQFANQIEVNNPL